MSRHVALLVCAFLACSTSFAQTEEFGKWRSLFNGRDVSGWVSAKKEQGKNVWKVADGALTNGKG